MQLRQDLDGVIEKFHENAVVHAHSATLFSGSADTNSKLLWVQITWRFRIFWAKFMFWVMVESSMCTYSYGENIAFQSKSGKNKQQEDTKWNLKNFGWSLFNRLEVA